MFSVVSRKSPILPMFLGLYVLGSLVWADSHLPTAHSAVLDLNKYDFEEDGPILLQGEWGFYWNIRLSEENFDDIRHKAPDHYMTVPSYWNGLAKTDPEVTAQGIATYRLDIRVKGSGEHLALKFRNITPNADIFVNGHRVAEIGSVNSDPAQSRSGNQILIVPIDAPDGIITLMVCISNFHNVKGGLNRPVLLGNYNDIRVHRERQLTVDALFLGGLLLMGLYQAALFLLDTKRKAPLFMAMLCLLAFFFSGFKHEMGLLAVFPFMDGEIRTKFIYLALDLAPTALTLYAYSLYPQHMKKWFNWVVTPISLCFGLLVILTPKSFFTRFLVPLEIQVLIVAVYILYTLISGYLKSRDKRLLYYLGGLGFLLAGIAFGVLDNEIFVPFQSVAGIFFVFILYQAFLQAYIFSHAFREIDILSVRKSDLEKQNVELFSLSYIDSLTGACNRRLMDDYLSSHWRVNSLSDRSLGMILIDIDDFKRYNDIYGHRQGDSCLVKVSQILRDTLAEIGQDTLARYGGEEFAVIVSDEKDMNLFAMAEKLRVAVEAAGIQHRGSRASSVVTISLGCTNPRAVAGTGTRISD